MPCRAEQGFLTEFREDVNQDISMLPRGGDRNVNVHRNNHAEEAKCHDACGGRELDGALQLELPECENFAA